MKGERGREQEDSGRPREEVPSQSSLALSESRGDGVEGERSPRRVEAKWGDLELKGKGHLGQEKGLPNLISESRGELGSERWVGSMQKGEGAVWSPGKSPPLSQEEGYSLSLSMATPQKGRDNSTVIFLRQESLTQDEAWEGGRRVRD